MNVLQAVILGIIQGLAEFLPISSSGHLALFQTIFKIQEPTITFNIFLHVATLIPVIVVYRRDIFELIRNPFQKMTILLILATIPAVIVSLLFGDFIDTLFNTSSYLWIGFFITGALLIYADTIKSGHKQGHRITGIDALIIGCMQAVAIIPGISRSGSTISASLSRKIDRSASAKFAFLMSIPAILGAVVLEVKRLITEPTIMENLSVIPMLFGFIAAMLSGFLAINFMIKLIKRCKLRYFAYYVFLLGIFILLDQMVTNFYF